jgi:hypothetical protein
VLAQDSLENRQAAADRYLKAVLISKMLADVIGEIERQLTENQRADIIIQQFRPYGLTRVCSTSVPVC